MEKNISTQIQPNLGPLTLAKTVTNVCGAIKDTWDGGWSTNIM